MIFFQILAKGSKTTFNFLFNIRIKFFMSKNVFSNFTNFFKDIKNITVKRIFKYLSFRAMPNIYFAKQM